VLANGFDVLWAMFLPGNLPVVGHKAAGLQT
jgi:hypothetical protein